MPNAEYSHTISDIVQLPALADPEEGHETTLLNMIDPQTGETTTITLKQGNPYRVSHTGGIPAWSDGSDVHLHQVEGIFALVTTTKDLTKGYTPVLRDVTLTYSPDSNPDVMLTTHLLQYPLRLYAGISTVEEFISAGSTSR